MEDVSSEVLRPRTLNKAADALCKSGLLRCHVTTRLAKERGNLGEIADRIFNFFCFLTATSVCNDLADTLHGIRFFIVPLRLGDD